MLGDNPVIGFVKNEDSGIKVRISLSCPRGAQAEL